MKRLVAVVLGLAGSCSEDTGPPPERAGRYGVFRDLVLYQRAPERGGPFFLDRFETTRSDWARYLRETGRSPSPALRAAWGGERPPAGTEHLPVGLVTVQEARAYARWRFGRLPTLEEWRHAAHGGGDYRFPWGDQPRPLWMNSGDLGLGEPTQVGTFESGRQPGGAYDLLGNVAEWTATVRRPALDGDAAPWERVGTQHAVVGGHYLSRLLAPAPPPGLGRVWWRSAAEYGSTVGVRVAADPAGLLQALLAEPKRPSARELELLGRFLRRPGVCEVLSAAWPAARAAVAAAGPLEPILARELAR